MTMRWEPKRIATVEILQSTYDLWISILDGMKDLELQTRPEGRMADQAVNTRLRELMGWEPLVHGCDHPADQLQIIPSTGLFDSVICRKCQRVWRSDR